MSEQTVAEWVLDANTCFLIGGGCSACAGKPLIEDLTKQVVESLPPPTKDLFSDLNGEFGRDPTVEDLVNHLLWYRRLLASKKTKDHSPWTVAKIDQQVAAIQHGIVKAINPDWKAFETHMKFFQRLAGQKSRATCDIFSLNYDTVLEASLEKLKFCCVDGFRGADNAFFDSAVYEEASEAELSFRLYKLHGSVNWVRDGEGTVRRRPFSSLEECDPVVVYPAEQKYVQTQYGVYETLLDSFRKRLREPKPNNKLIVLGYSFRDEHINLAIQDSLQSEAGSLTVYAFLGSERDPMAQKERLQQFADGCHGRFNALVGQHTFIGPGLDGDEWDAVKPLDLWKFEHLVGMLVGEKHEPEPATYSQSG